MLAACTVRPWGELLECILRRDGVNGLLGKGIGIFQRLDNVVLAGQLSNHFGINGRLHTESIEKEILRFSNVRDLLGEGAYSLKARRWWERNCICRQAWLRRQQLPRSAWPLKSFP